MRAVVAGLMAALPNRPAPRGRPAHRCAGADRDAVEATDERIEAAVAAAVARVQAAHGARLRG